MSNDEGIIDSDSSVEENEQDEETEKEEAERKRIRENLSTLSFEELIQMKEKLGAKIYNETVYGNHVVKVKNSKNLKRANKNRPREISSKIRPKQVNKLFGSCSSTLQKSRDFASRDPRFDTMCGEFDSVIFKQNYKFVNEIRKKEKEQLEKEYVECTDPERKKIIKLLKQRIENQLREEENRSKKKEKEESERKEMKEKLNRGEKPVYKKRSVRRLEGLVEKYEELKRSNKLQKHLERRTKKLKVKDRKMMENNIVT